MWKIHAVSVSLAFVLLAGLTWAGTPCTIVARADTGEIVSKDGSCDVRNSPASTFKLALALMGYDADILTSAHSPAWPYKQEYPAWDDGWKKTSDPTTWLSDSVVWYSQVLAKKLGKKRLQGYVDAFDYGNRDLSADTGAEGELFPAIWVDSSLQISPVEQVGFLRKLLNAKLPVSPTAYEKTLAIVPTFPLANGWVVHGKTGAGFQSGHTAGAEPGRQFGWFVGWVDTGKHIFVFARLIKDDQRIKSRAGFRARDSLLADLPSLLLSDR